MNLINRVRHFFADFNRPPVPLAPVIPVLPGVRFRRNPQHRMLRARAIVAKKQYECPCGQHILPGQVYIRAEAVRYEPRSIVYGTFHPNCWGIPDA